MTTSTLRAFTAPVKSILTLGRKVQTEWGINPGLFSGFRHSKSDLDATFAAAESADAAFRSARDAREAEQARVRQARDEAIARAKSEYAAALSALDDSVLAAARERKEKATALSRMANGARHYALGAALSDEDEANDSVKSRI